jgi:P27 family predicted phage terminase small subunit
MPGTRRSGRKRLPTALKVARGSKIRHNVAAEPSAPVGVPQAPPHLTEEGRAAWNAMAARLLAQHVLTTAHGELLALLADAWATYVRLQRAYADGGYQSVLTLEWADERGRERRRVISNPLFNQVRQQAQLVNALLGEFGQTPASAPKVSTFSDSPDPFDRFLNAGPDTNVVKFARRKRPRAAGGT